MPDSTLLPAFKGLEEEEAAKRLEIDGPNELPTVRKRGGMEILRGILTEPIFLLLIACGGIYLLLGDVQEALMLLSFVVVIIGITTYQEGKTENALEALRSLSSPRALVVRNGTEQRIAGREVVCGDILLLSEGDRVPADARVLQSSNLMVDESILTGESVPVMKVPARAEEAVGGAGGEEREKVFAGTLVVSGRGWAEVEATGPRTRMGKIGLMVQVQEEEDTRLQVETRRLVRNFALLGLVLCTAVTLLYSLAHSDLLGGILAGLTLAMAILPEEFPVVLTVFLALGAWRLSQRNVLTRRMVVLEALGAGTVLCVDKTGTITQNRMEVAALLREKELLNAEAAGQSLPERLHELVEYAVLASQKDPLDPMEKALRKFGERVLRGTEHLHAEWTPVQEYPLCPELLAMSIVWRAPDSRRYLIAAKGAPEAIADLCHMAPEERQELVASIEVLSERGMRILGIARAEFSESELPGIQHEFAFQFLGLVGFSDPIRPGVAESVKECRRAGIRVIMITGDYPGTARKVAEEIGLNTGAGIATGPELESMTSSELMELAGRVNVFARIAPAQKLRIVQALKARGETVAMTGDGVNDAPALKAADIGIAMGMRGSDVAREAAPLVLLDDNFTSIVAAVKGGRRIFDNLKKAIAYILAIHVPIAGISLLSVVLKWPLVLLPIHIVFLELVIDPACSVVFEAEPEEKGIMSRPPRRKDEALFDRRTILYAVAQGAGLLAIVAFIFGFTLGTGAGEEKARALAFATLMIGNLSLILANRSWQRSILEKVSAPNPAHRWVTAGAIAALLLIVLAPPVSSLFHISTLSAPELGACLLLGALCLAWTEAFGTIFRRMDTDNSSP